MYLDAERDEYEDETKLYRKSYDVRVWYQGGVMEACSCDCDCKRAASPDMDLCVYCHNAHWEKE